MGDTDASTGTAPQIGQILKLDEAKIRTHLDGVVRSTV